MQEISWIEIITMIASQLALLLMWGAFLIAFKSFMLKGISAMLDAKIVDQEKNITNKINNSENNIKNEVLKVNTNQNAIISNLERKHFETLKVNNEIVGLLQTKFNKNS